MSRSIREPTQHRPNPGVYVEPADVASWILGAFVLGLIVGAFVGVAGFKLGLTNGGC